MDEEERTRLLWKKKRKLASKKEGGFRSFRLVSPVEDDALFAVVLMKRLSPSALFEFEDKLRDLRRFLSRHLISSFDPTPVPATAHWPFDSFIFSETLSDFDPVSSSETTEEPSSNDLDQGEKLSSSLFLSHSFPDVLLSCRNDDRENVSQTQTPHLSSAARDRLRKLDLPHFWPRLCASEDCRRGNRHASPRSNDKPQDRL